MYTERLKKRRDGDESDLYELDPKDYKAESLLKVMCSITLAVFYGIPLLASIIILISNIF